jgi:hypothetical protein
MLAFRSFKFKLRDSDGRSLLGHSDADLHHIAMSTAAAAAEVAAAFPISFSAEPLFWSSLLDSTNE